MLSTASTSLARRRALTVLAQPVSQRPLSSSSLPKQAAANKSGLIQSLLHGTDEQPLPVLQHSKLIGRGKYVHELVRHRIVPSQAEAYRRAAEQHYGSLTGGPDGQLMGSWECVAGDLDTHIHIIRHQSMASLTPALLRPAPPDLLAHVTQRESSLLQEFAFSPAHDNPNQRAAQAAAAAEAGDGEAHIGNHVFELRSYRLKPGSMLEWEAHWRKGIEARRRFVEPAGAWFSQVGPLHTVHHLWAFPSLAARKELRDRAWSVSGWADTVRETVKLAQGMSSQILVPSSWSPLK